MKTGRPEGGIQTMTEDYKRLQAFLDAHPDIEVFEVMLPDIGGGLRGKWVTRDKIHKVFAGGLKLPLSALAFDVWGRDVDAFVGGRTEERNEQKGEMNTDRDAEERELEHVRNVVRRGETATRLAL